MTWIRTAEPAAATGPLLADGLGIDPEPEWPGWAGGGAEDEGR